MSKLEELRAERPSFWAGPEDWMTFSDKLEAYAEEAERKLADAEETLRMIMASPGGTQKYILAADALARLEESSEN